MDSPRSSPKLTGQNKPTGKSRPKLGAGVRDQKNPMRKLPAPDGKRYEVSKKVSFRPASYLIDVEVELHNLTDVNLESKDKNFATFELGRNYYVSAAYAF